MQSMNVFWFKKQKKRKIIVPLQFRCWKKYQKCEMCSDVVKCEVFKWEMNLQKYWTLAKVWQEQHVFPQRETIHLNLSLAR